MIDGNALIMSLNDWWYSSFGQEETEESKAIKTVVDEVEKYVDGYPTYREWIPCSERLPETSVYVLVSTSYGDVMEAIIREDYSGEKYWFHRREELPKGFIVAWMPLPKPYKAESEDKE